MVKPQISYIFFRISPAFLMSVSHGPGLFHRAVEVISGVSNYSGMTRSRSAASIAGRPWEILGGPEASLGEWSGNGRKMPKTKAFYTFLHVSYCRMISGRLCDAMCIWPFWSMWFKWFCWFVAFCRFRSLGTLLATVSMSIGEVTSPGFERRNPHKNWHWR